jgi:hypothetical protein
MNQRWYQRLGTWRDANEVIDTRAYEVAELLDDATPKRFVEEHHYSGSYPAARARYGLYRLGGGYMGKVVDVLARSGETLSAEHMLSASNRDLVGVAVFSHPPNEAVLKKLPCDRMAGIELGRFVLLSSVPGNGESWFLARCFELLRARGIEALVSHSDPLPRRTVDGALVLPGHVGQIYQATNAIYGGRTKARALWLLPDGTVFSERAMSKIRARERGYRYAIDQLVAHGAEKPLDLGQDLTAWLADQLPIVGRRVRHRGNHRYLWAINKRLRKDIAKLAIVGEDGEPLAYPKKLDDEAVAA